MKRISALFLALILVFSFAACSKDASSNKSTEPQSGSSADASSDAGVDSTQDGSTVGDEGVVDDTSNYTEYESDFETDDVDSEQEIVNDGTSDLENDDQTSNQNSEDEETKNENSSETTSKRPASSSSSTTKPAPSTSGSEVSGTTSTPPQTSGSQTSSSQTTTVTTVTDTTTVPPVTDEPIVTPAEPAPSYKLKGNISTSANADYNTPNVSYSSIFPGAGPLTSHNIYVGTNNFMFLGETVGDYIGSNLYGDSKLKKLAVMMNERDAWAKENGIKLYFMICPNKATVYSDYVPSSLTAAEYTRLDQIYDYMAKNSTVEMIDLRAPLKSARSVYGDSLYYKFDTHWTQDAGFVAYTELMNHVVDDLPGAVRYSSYDFNVNTYETYMKDMPYYLGYYDDFYDEGSVYSLKVGPDASLIKKKNDGNWGQFLFAYQWPNGYRDNLKYFRFRSKNTDAPSVYVYRDSFSIALVPFIKESFYESTFDWDRNFSRSEILDSGADTVIIQVVEKSIGEIVQSRTFID